VLCFSSFKNILDYLSKQKILPFKNYGQGENLIFDSPKMICLNCLLTISKNKTEFEKFIGAKKNKHNYDNDFDNPFHDLYENPNLKLFNDIDPKKKKIINQNETNEMSEGIFKKICKPEPKKASLINNAPNSNIINNPKINFDFYNIINYYYPSSSINHNHINHNTTFNENISNNNLPDYYINDKNQKNTLHYSINNRSYIPYNPFLNKSEGLLTQNNTNILNIYQFPKLNKKNYSMEKKIIIENGRNKIMNINVKNDIKNKAQDNNKNLKQNNIWKSFSISENKNQLFLLNKNDRNLNLYNKYIVKV